MFQETQDQVLSMTEYVSPVFPTGSIGRGEIWTGRGNQLHGLTVQSKHQRTTESSKEIGDIGVLRLMEMGVIASSSIVIRSCPHDLTSGTDDRCDGGCGDWAPEFSVR